MKILENKFFGVALAFILGSVLTYFALDYIHLKKYANDKTPPIHESKRMSESSPFPKDSSPRSSDPFQQMDKIHQQMRKRMDQFFRGGLFDDSFMDSDSFSFSNHNNLKIEHEEDNLNKYIIISAPGLNSNEINIDISNGMVNISGEINHQAEDVQAGSKSSSSYMSRFSQSFNIPDGVNENKVKIENDKNKIIIKFPKEQI